MARAVMRKHLDMNDPANQHFLHSPDAREQHQTRWHQWGIITHTRVFLRHFDKDIPSLLTEWGLWTDTESIMSRQIDGVSRWNLLRISILLHDIGKFGSRTQGATRFHFAHHESLSGTIIREELRLERYGLTQAQIKYIAMTAEDHFVLALVRKRVREDGEYDSSYASGPNFLAVCRSIEHEHPCDFVEIGLLFLGDSMSKVDPTHGPTDAVGQYEVNIVFARQYLEAVLRVES
jgi:HD domain